MTKWRKELGRAPFNVEKMRDVWYNNLINIYTTKKKHLKCPLVHRQLSKQLQKIQKTLLQTTNINITKQKNISMSCVPTVKKTWALWGGKKKKHTNVPSAVLAFRYPCKAEQKEAPPYLYVRLILLDNLQWLCQVHRRRALRVSQHQLDIYLILALQIRQRPRKRQHRRKRSLKHRHPSRQQILKAPQIIKRPSQSKFKTLKTASLLM